jgi:hypothetical protein
VALDNSLRWYLDLGFAGIRIVGKVWQTSPPETGTKGGIRPAAPWVAVGMAKTWADTDLGNAHSTRADAMRAVSEWWDKQKPAELEQPK